MLAISSPMLFLGCLEESNGTNAVSASQVTIAEPAVSLPEDSEIDAAPLRAVIPPADLSAGVSEVVKLVQSGVGEEVLLAYLEKSGRTFNPTVDEIVYLKDLGLSETALAALVRQGNPNPEVAQSGENKAAPAEPTSALPAPPISEPAPSYSAAANPTPNDATVVPPQQVNISYFEQTLSPYGSWIEVADYGRCWQPTVVVINRDWRPYADRGRWIYSSAGWYWQSDYSWGWAPFHYGRWHCDDRVGWVWLPGSTWGPAWVSWRYTDQYCGWAPLPPTAHYDGFGFRYRNSHVGFSFDFGLRDDCYTFVPASRFCDRYPYRYYASRSHSGDIFRHSVVANNYRRGHDNNVFNEGIGRHRIAGATGTSIKTVPLRDLPTTANPVGRAERLEGNSLTVFRPSAAAQSTLARRQPIGSRTTSPSPTTENTSSTSLSSSSSQDRILLTRPASGHSTSASVTQNQQPAVTTTPSRPTGQTFLRSPQPSGTRSSRPTVQEQPATIANAGASPTSLDSRVTSAPQDVNSRRSGSTTFRQLPAQNTTQQRSTSFGRSVETASPSPGFPIAQSGSTGTAPVPAQRESRATTTVRSQPGISQIQREQPAMREMRRQESPTRDDGGGRRSIAPSSAMSAPVQRQPTFNTPNRSDSAVQSSVQRQPSYSAPSPAPVLRAQPPSSMREAERSNRSDRKRS
ncbi:MAG: DUF6600 domain-containing protein [Verrucomicrobiota bacterium]